MKARISQILWLAVTALTFGPITPAQQIKLGVWIPLDFVLGDTLHTAGHYIVRTEIPNNVLCIEGEHANPVLTLSIAAVSSVASTKAKLVFHRIGKTYFLCQIWGGKSERAVSP